jgi:hypothetical protein
LRSVKRQQPRLTRHYPQIIHTWLGHDSEKWEPAFGKDHAPSNAKEATRDEHRGILRRMAEAWRKVAKEYDQDHSPPILL